MKKKVLQRPASKKTKKDRGLSAEKRKALESTSSESPRIVGMGGSAGGLEAFEQFLSLTPNNTGAAFVLISHLDPTRKGIMPEILQRKTPLKVVQAEDGMKVEPNAVYVIPPNADISIQKGKLLLMEPLAPRGLRMPINYFFQHLAADQRERAIGIVLSGMGSDGSQGIRAIKEHSGLVLVQDPTQAKFDGMPQSAIATGLADYVGPVEELPAKLMQFLARSPAVPKESFSEEEASSTSLAKVFALLQTHTGNDFSCYKKSTIYRRIERRMSIHQFDKIAQYVRFLQETPAEIDLLYKELLIGVTNFFRDHAMFDFFKEKAFPQLMKNREKGVPLRVWMPACSTGEEPYSLAIVLHEVLHGKEYDNIPQIQIFATDIDEDAIEKARRGTFPPSIASDLSPERLNRYFLIEGEDYRVKKEIRDMVIFAPQNVIVDPPFTKLDILCCRNLLIYLNVETQKKLLSLFHYALNPGGVLILGSAESLGESSHLFAPLDKKLKLYERLQIERKPEIRMHASLVRGKADRPSAPERYQAPVADASFPLQRAMLDIYAPPAVAVNPQGDILYVNGRTGKFLEPSSGKVNVNVFAMAREGLREKLGPAISSAIKSKTAVAVKGLKVKTNGGYSNVDLTVRPLVEPGVPREMLLLTFEEAPEAPAEPAASKKKPGSSREHGPNQDLHEELSRTKQQLQWTIEEMDAMQEELRSANEELQSNNEELQSTNEELTTAKEELQSLNEETQTVNAELQTKIELLSQTNDDMKNLLNGTDIATIFLDNDLSIKRFTPQAVKIVNFIGGDVGRPLAHLSTNIRYGRLVEDAKEVLETLTAKDLQVLSNDDRWYSLRILPYRTADNVIDGVVITLVDITAMKQLDELLRRRQDELQEAREHAENILAAVREPILVLDQKQRVVSASHSFYDLFHIAPQNAVGRLLFEVDRGQWDIPELRQFLEKIFHDRQEAETLRIERDFPNLGHRDFLLNARRITRADHDSSIILLTMEENAEAPSPEKPIDVIS